MPVGMPVTRHLWLQLFNPVQERQLSLPPSLFLLGYLLSFAHFLAVFCPPLSPMFALRPVRAHPGAVPLSEMSGDEIGHLIAVRASADSYAFTGNRKQIQKQEAVKVGGFEGELPVYETKFLTRERSDDRHGFLSTLRPRADHAPGTPKTNLGREPFPYVEFKCLLTIWKAVSLVGHMRIGSLPQWLDLFNEGGISRSEIFPNRNRLLLDE